MNIHFAFRQSVLTLFIAIGILATAQAQELSFTLHEQFVIGDDEEAPAEYIFSYPQVVRTDSKGNIYVHDHRRADIRVFNSGGRYVTTVGKRGAGPGEMQSIIGMHVDDQDRLIVSDQVNARFTIFTDLGKNIETKAFAEKGAIYPDPILSLEDAFVLRYVKLIDDPEGGPSIRGDKVLHLHDTELNQLESLAQLGDIFDLDRPFLKAHSDSRSALKVVTDGSDTIILAPTVYDGYVYRYTQFDDTWVMEKLKGGRVPRRAYMLFSESDYEANPDLRRASIVKSTRTGVYRAKVFNWSLGIAILGTGEIVNFTMQTPIGKDFYLTAELFDQNGTLVGYGPLQFDDPKLNSSRRVMMEIAVLWKDAADRVYLRRRNEAGFYVLSVAKLVVNRL